MTLSYRIDLLEKKHNRTAFDCGVTPLNEYFQKRVGQDIRRRITACYVAVENATEVVAGYYTLAAGSVDLKNLPEEVEKKLPRYPSIPIVRVGRLAVDQHYQKRRLGSILLFDAIKRTAESDIAAYAVIVDAKDDQAARFYEHHGFMNLPSAENRTLFLPISKALKELASRSA